jgi:prepilin-type N-terminal cleavage/methylation domain-containing protein/prepilin-type processing-associated H-X9-DG protein
MARIRTRKAFSLIELLVVVAIIALLVTILLPSLDRARQQAKNVNCQSNVRQLGLANFGYALENAGHLVPAAKDIHLSNYGHHRWHGYREHANDPFDPLRGPLASYLADGKVKQCPSFTEFHTGPVQNESFEKGNGGYGYNLVYLGSQNWKPGLFMAQANARTTMLEEIGSPAGTLMFADTAILHQVSGVTRTIEYSFTQAPYHLVNGEIVMSLTPRPSLHFRHEGRNNITWADGHVADELIAPAETLAAMNVTEPEYQIGWFEPMDNSRFDLK